MSEAADAALLTAPAAGVAMEAAEEDSDKETDIGGEGRKNHSNGKLHLFAEMCGRKFLLWVDESSERAGGSSQQRRRGKIYKGTQAGNFGIL